MNDRNASQAEIEQLLLSHAANSPPSLTAEGKFLSAVFLDLRNSTGSGGFSPNPISWSENRSYRKEARLKKFSKWALNLLHVADGIYLEWTLEEIKKDLKKK